MRLLPPCGKAGAPAASQCFPSVSAAAIAATRGRQDRKKCFPAYCLKSRNSDRIQRPLRAKPAGNLSGTREVSAPVLLLRKGLAGNRRKLWYFTAARCA